MELNYKSFGQGDPIIILHGLFGSLDNWQTFAKALSKDLLVYIVDQRDHGKSPHTQEFNYDLLADDLLHFMEKNWIYSAHIMGHSMGGKTAMQFAYSHPDMVEKLIVLDIAPKRYLRSHDLIFDALMGLDLNKINRRSEAKEMIADKIREDSVREFLLKNLKRNKDGTFRWKMNLPLLYENYDQISGGFESDEKIELPSLFVNGSLSNYIMSEDKELIKQFFDNVEFETIEGAGHWLHSDKPEELRHILLDFIT